MEKRFRPAWRVILSLAILLSARAYSLAGDECPPPQTTDWGPNPEIGLHKMFDKLMLASGSKQMSDIVYFDQLEWIEGSPAALVPPGMEPNDKDYPIIGVTPKLLEIAQSKDELAFLIAHEVVHLTEEHTVEASATLQRLYARWSLQQIGKGERPLLLPTRWQDIQDTVIALKFLAYVKPQMTPIILDHEKTADAEGLALVLAAYPNFHPPSAECAMAHMNDLVVALGLERSASLDDTHDSIEVRRERLRDFVNALRP